MPATTATEALVAMFQQYGLADLAAEFAALVADPNLTEAQVLTQVYDLPSYKARFPAMDYLRKTGQVWTEAQYFQQEAAYKRVLDANNLPAGFYDTPSDFAKWIENSVAPDELNKRIVAAQRIVESSDPSLRQAAMDYYGIDTAHAVAYALDPEKAQPLIDKQMRIIEAGAAGNRYGFNLNLDQATAITTDPLTENLDPVSLRQRFGQARDLANTDARLSAIDGLDYTQQDALDAVLRDDQAKQLQSRQRAEREAARFSGTSGFGSKSLKA